MEKTRLITPMWKIVDSPEFYMQCIFNNQQTSFPCKKIYAVVLIFKHRNHFISAEPRFCTAVQSFQKFKPHNISANAYTKLVSISDAEGDIGAALP